MNKQPEVTAQTRRRFLDAFWSLTEEGPVNRITVGEVTKRAGYNRSTFYEYFADMPALLRAAEEEMLDQFQQMAMEHASEIKDKGAPDDVLFQTVFIVMNEKLYRLLGPDGDPAFFPMLKARLLPIFMRILPLTEEIPNVDYVVSFAYSAVIGVLQFWHERGKDIPAEEMSQLVRTLMFHGIQSFFV